MQVITRWDPSGDGSVDKGEFRSNVFALGVVAEAAAVDALFEELDDDGGGSLDVAELKVCGARRAHTCLLYTSPSPRDLSTSRMPSSA